MVEKSSRIRPLVASDDPILKTKLDVYDIDADHERNVEVARILADNMIHYGGVGIAANQLGMTERVFTMKVGQQVYACFNPEIIHSEGEIVELEEGCLSFKGLIIKVKRPNYIRVRYKYPNGENVIQTFTGMTARIFQHELDHLNGKVMLDHVSKLKQDIAWKKLRKRTK